MYTSYNILDKSLERNLIFNGFNSSALNERPDAWVYKVEKQNIRTLFLLQSKANHQLFATSPLLDFNINHCLNE